ncbi:MAG: galactokinase [Bacteroidales bacterium]|jgi:galactokinase|nr:galactokinase [Bacteroidales bacterium]MCI2121657.1 galactokinase [Bacteroidales bacterium]MCI2144971.1 galactokinase [Bacteroidales bacterium]
MKEQIHEQFKKYFNAEGEFYASAGRINLIGEHTDYNGGFVFPGAIDKCIMAEIRKNGTGKVRAYALDVKGGDYVEFGLKEDEGPKQSWARYIFGVCREIQKRGGVISGFDTAFSGNVPLGAGMSSSAALESTFAFALNEMFSLGIDKFELAKIGQATEHNYCGVNCGIMDQFASIFGKKDCLIRLDCRSLEYKYFPFHPNGYRLVLVDTVVKHELASSAYNDRRHSCEHVVDVIRKSGHSGVEFLRDCDLQMLEGVRPELSGEDYDCAKYVIEEIQRVLDVCEALEKDDYETVGKKMYETHWGMSKLYKVSCKELDFLVKLAEKCGVTGSRVMGGGFGGCTINLVKDGLYDKFVSEAHSKYEIGFGHAPKIYDVVISDGAHRI